MCAQLLIVASECVCCLFCRGWDDVSQLCSHLLWKITGQTLYANKLETFLNQWLPAASGGSIPYTPLGLVWRAQWAPIRYATTTAALALAYADSIYATNAPLANTYHAFAVAQVHYALGSSGRSFVVGFGSNPPTHEHHRGASCPDRPQACGWDQYNSGGANPQVLLGALVGGPAQDDSYNDVRSNYVQNEVACDYNAGFTGALARFAMEASSTPATAGDGGSGGGTLTPVLGGDSSSSADNGGEPELMGSSSTARGMLNDAAKRTISAVSMLLCGAAAAVMLGAQL